MIQPITDEELLKNKALRVEYCKYDFLWWFTYHYWREDTAEFQKERARSMQSDKNTMIEWFRWSRKTTLARWYVVWSACYNKDPYIVRQSYEQWASSDNVRQIAKMLFKKSVVNDYWLLFPLESKKEDLAKKSLHNFETTNKVRIVAKSLWENLRGANEYDMDDEVSSRPTLLVFDDVDVTDSVQNTRIIDKNMKKITGETIEAMDQFQRKIIFLWNCILEDGVVPRFVSLFKNSLRWNVFRQPLFDKDGNNTRPLVFTEEVVTKLKEASTKTSWNQNYLLNPDTMGNGIFIRDYFDYFLLSHFEQVDGILKKHDLRCGIFIDPAFSTSDISDDAVVIWAGEHVTSKQKYLIDGYSDTSAPSRTINAIIVMYNNLTALWFKVMFISCEDVSLNKQQTQFIKDLRDELMRYSINVPLRLYKPRLNKNQRIKDNLEWPMSQQWWKFNRNISQPNFITKLERQLLEFPNGDNDDHIDCLAQAEAVFKQTQEKQISIPKARTIIDPRTGKKITTFI